MEIRIGRRHRSERLTRSGLLLFLAIVSIGAVAVNSGNNLLYLVFSALLSFLILSGILSVLNLQHVQVSLDAAGDVVAGQPSVLVLHVRAAGRFPLFFAQVQPRLDVTTSVVEVPYIPGGTGQELTSTFTVPRRGRITGATVTLSSAFPFGIVEMRRELAAAGELVVYPAVRPVEVRVQTGEGEHRLEQSRAGGDGDFFSLRRYRAGDDARSIDWKAWARSGMPYVVEREARYLRETVVYLETARSAWPDDAAFETAVTKVASALTQAFEAGDALALALPGQFVHGRDRRAWQEAMELLADVQPSPGSPSPRPRHSVTAEDIVLLQEGA
ncbi:MAG TPA: DUF58 domain-containing protein [Candidatus Cryosericum sp.]|nr:DUF58 domain-containing protein [Candidatus Cryosericum sp.]